MTDEIEKTKSVSEATKKWTQGQQIRRLHNRRMQIQQQVATQRAILSYGERGGVFSPRQMGAGFRSLEERKAVRFASQEQVGEAFSESVEGEEALAEFFYENNRELQKKMLLNLNNRIRDDADYEEIIAVLEEALQDETLMDEALDFLILASENREERKEMLIATKERFNRHFGREIMAGKNMRQQALAFSEKGLGTPTALRDVYRQVTGKEQEAHDLFEELSEQFAFSDMEDLLDFLLHSLGADLKAKGSSILKAELTHLCGETQKMQAILGLFAFFEERIETIKKQFKKKGMPMPLQMNFERLGKLLIQILREKYPSSHKILAEIDRPLGLQQILAAQIIVCIAYRDAMRQISPRLFYSEKHRQELLLTLLETLEDLEDEEEEEEE
ncbi:MAG: HrpJ domain-containing protein [Chlamydiota bacterium]|nr:HrpJ domain-containing protein [Chlamydiota bacterium]